MRVLMLAVMATVAAPTSASVTVAVDAANRSVLAHSKPLPIHVGGRVALAPLASPAPRNAHAYLHQWPAVYWEAAFIGDRITLKFDDEKNEYRLSIDDEPPIVLPQPGQVEVTASGLSPGRHRVRLDKVTESVDFARAFDGFFIPPGEAVLPAPSPRARQVEFIGDSAMTGYGVRSTSRTCTKEEVRLRTDSSAAWPSLVAHRLDADYQINAMSGRGLVRNYGGGEPGRVMSVLYPRTLPDAPTIWQDGTWHPQVTVVLLFADFVTDLKPGELWPDQAALVASYTRTYEQLIETLHARSPSTTLVLPWLDFTKYHDEAARALSTTVQSAIRAKAAAVGVPRVAFPLLPDFTPENSACDYHGSFNDHRRMAEWMTAWLQARPELWRSRPSAARAIQ